MRRDDRAAYRASPWRWSVVEAKRFALLALLSLSLVACATRSVVSRPANADGQAQMLQAIAAQGEPGDWLVIRGIHATDNLVASLSNQPLSHAAVFDPERGQVIEAEAIGVHATPLADFVGKSARLLLIKPQGATAETRAAAVAKARARIGRPYDFLGLVGLDQAERYYCSELALSVFPRAVAGNPRPWVVPPGQLWHWGRIVYDSGPTP